VLHDHHAGQCALSSALDHPEQMAHAFGREGIVTAIPLPVSALT
jgi:hypothetical protein